MTRIAIRLTASFLLIIVIISAIFSVVGIRFIGNRIVAEAQNRVEMDLNAAREIYSTYLSDLHDVLRFTAVRFYLRNAVLAGDIQRAAGELQNTLTREGLDILTVTDRDGTVLLRAANPDVAGDSQADDELVRAVLERGAPVAATAVVGEELLQKECPLVAERAVCELVETPRARPRDETEETAGMVLKAAAPIFDYRGNVIGVVYGGLLLNQRYDIVDKIKATVFQREQYRGRDIGTATIFCDDVRISTNVMNQDGTRAIGTRVSEDVYNRAVKEGDRWIGRAYVVNSWYISAYEPIRDIEGRVVGILYVGILEEPYLELRRRTILLFLAITLGGAILAVGLSYLISRTVSVPIKQLVYASREVARGNLDAQVAVRSNDELAELANAFNQMASALRRMKGDLQEWGRTLEEKVRQRTDELVAMQARVAQSERLASVGMLAAGVAHEINNPLGGILALTALTLEDLPQDDPNRENLEEVVGQCERCREIVKGLLEFSRQSETGAERIAINETLEDTLSLIEKQSLFFNIRLLKHLDPELPAVTGDKSQLQQVFINIIMNAVQAMAERGTLTLVTRRAADGFVEVVICDTGCGIAASEIDHIFDPFYSTKGGGEGTGLGLSIAYGIVAKHHGSIAVESEPGKGSTFTIRLLAAPEFTGIDQT
ncbi:MAG: cache domain-containing protein [Gemmatimonadota bacterium]|nr:MAG: cache domain-containing protein [Gemmatimonadota bacterium]